MHAGIPTGSFGYVGLYCQTRLVNGTEWFLVPVWYYVRNTQTGSSATTLVEVGC